MSRNSIYGNGGKGISLENHVQNDIAPPRTFSKSMQTITGITGPNCTVELFSGPDDEGQYYEGMVIADATGHFSFTHSTTFTGPEVTVLATDTSGNSSEFGCVPLITDTDGDGLPDDWEQLYFSSPTGSNRNEDSDGDGYSNLREFRAGTDPLNSFDVLQTTIQKSPGEGEMIHFPTVSGRHYRIERNDHFPAQPWMIVQDNITGTGMPYITIDAVPPSVKTAIYRVIVLP